MTRHQTCAVDRADYNTATAGDEHHMWFLQGPNFVNANGDAGHRHGHGTERSQKVWQALSIPMMSAEREDAGLDL